MSLETQVLSALPSPDAALEPLPTTRALGDRFGVSHVTVSRVLRRLADEGKLWQADNGRFYHPRAADSLAKIRPVSCLVRSINGWAAWYQQIMKGVSLVCEEQDRGIFLNPISALIRQQSPVALATYASTEEQRETFEAYLKRNEERAEFVLLDDAWSDEILCDYGKRLVSPRMLLRPSPCPEIESFYPDYAQGSMLALSHLLGRGFKRFLFVQPYPNYQVPRHFQAVFQDAFASIGGIDARLEVFETLGSERFPALLAQLAASKERVALICPEDNFSVALLHALHEAAFDLPGKIGLLAAMGSPMLENAHLTRVVVDFCEIGQKAVQGTPDYNRGPCVRFSLKVGATT